MTYNNDDLKRCVLEWVLADWPGSGETYTDGLTPELFDRLMAGDTPDEVRAVELFADWYLPALLEQFYRFADSVRRCMTASVPTPAPTPAPPTYEQGDKMRLVLRANLSIGTMTDGCGALVDRDLWERMSGYERDELALSCMRDMLDMADWSYVAVPAMLEADNG